MRTQTPHGRPTATKGHRSGEPIDANYHPQDDLQGPLWQLTSERQASSARCAPLTPRCTGLKRLLRPQPTAGSSSNRANHGASARHRTLRIPPHAHLLRTAAHHSAEHALLAHDVARRRLDSQAPTQPATPVRAVRSSNARKRHFIAQGAYREDQE